MESQMESLARDSDRLTPGSCRSFQVESRCSPRPGTSMGPPMAPPAPVAKSHHPNQNVVLEELEEGKPIEQNQNVILPDEILNYLSEVAEQDQRPESALSEAVTSVSQYVPPPARVPLNNGQCKSPQRMSCMNHASQSQVCASNAQQNWSSCNSCCQNSHNNTWASNQCSHDPNNHQNGASASHQNGMVHNYQNGLVPNNQNGPMVNRQSGQTNHQNGHMPNHQNGLVPNYQNGPVPNYQNGPTPNHQNGHMPNHPNRSMPNFQNGTMPNAVQNYSNGLVQNSGSNSNGVIPSAANGLVQNGVPNGMVPNHAAGVPCYPNVPNAQACFQTNGGQQHAVQHCQGDSNKNPHSHSNPSNVAPSTASNRVSYNANPVAYPANVPQPNVNSIPNNHMINNCHAQQSYNHTQASMSSQPSFNDTQHFSGSSMSSGNQMTPHPHNNFNNMPNHSNPAATYNTYTGSPCYGNESQYMSQPNQNSMQSSGYGPNMNQHMHCMQPNYPSNNFKKNSNQPQQENQNVPFNAQPHPNSFNSALGANPNLQVMQSQYAPPTNVPQSNNHYNPYNWSNSPYNSNQSSMYNGNPNHGNLSPNYSYPEQHPQFNSNQMPCNVNHNQFYNQQNHNQMYNPNQNVPINVNHGNRYNSRPGVQNTALPCSNLMIKTQNENDMLPLNQNPQPNAQQCLNVNMPHQHCGINKAGACANPSSQMQNSTEPPQYPCQQQTSIPEQYRVIPNQFQELNAPNNASNHVDTACQNQLPVHGGNNTQCPTHKHGPCGAGKLDEKDCSVPNSQSVSTNPKEMIQCQNVSQSSLSAEAYKRTLKYVQQCQENLNKELPSPGCNRVSSSTDRRSPAVSESPLQQTSNMTVNDLQSGLCKLANETNMYFNQQLLQ